MICGPWARPTPRRGVRGTSRGAARFRAAAACYRELFGDADGRFPATFQVLYLTGWRPHDSQQQPARRGSGTVGLTQVLNPRER